MSEELIAHTMPANREVDENRPIENEPKDFDDIYKLFCRMDEILTVGFRKKLEDDSFQLGQCWDGSGGGIFLDPTLFKVGKIGVYCFFFKDGKEYGNSVSCKGSQQAAKIVETLFRLKYPCHAAEDFDEDLGLLAKMVAADIYFTSRPNKKPELKQFLGIKKYIPILDSLLQRLKELSSK